MEILKSKILSLDVSSSVKAMLLNRVSKIKGCKVLIDDSINSVEIVPKYFKEYQKGIQIPYQDCNFKKSNQSGGSKNNMVGGKKSEYGFQSNLSILDLLFHEGPESLNYLTKLINH